MRKWPLVIHKTSTYTGVYDDFLEYSNTYLNHLDWAPDLGFRERIY